MPKRQKFGWYFEPSYEYKVGPAHEQSVAIGRRPSDREFCEAHFYPVSVTSIFTTHHLGCMSECEVWVVHCNESGRIVELHEHRTGRHLGKILSATGMPLG
ncbi:MAG: hypothetical protein JO249_13980 [Acidobacteria bacterium]|nr:hypothetical protein [Acidobacteriota bacterium]